MRNDKGKDRATTQISLDFRPGLVKQWPNFKALVAHVVYSSPGGPNAIAIRCDRSPSLMTRMLALDSEGSDTRHLPIQDLVAIIEETKDFRPIYWLIERFLEDRDVKRERVKDELMALLPQIQRALSELED